MSGTEHSTRLTIRAMQAGDWPAVSRVYAEGLATGDATFESEVPSWSTWDADHLAEHRWVATIADAGAEGHADDVIGWVACTPVSGRCVYAGVLEVSVYVAAAVQGRGVGSALVRAVIDSTEAAGVWTLQAGIFRENVASLALHARHGFRTVGHRERLGRTVDGAWRDVVLVERRSTAVG